MNTDEKVAMLLGFLLGSLLIFGVMSYVTETKEKEECFNKQGIYTKYGCMKKDLFL